MYASGGDWGAAGQEAGWGALAGGVTGGLIGGVSSVLGGKNFWSGMKGIGLEGLGAKPLAIKDALGGKLVYNQELGQYVKPGSVEAGELQVNSFGDRVVANDFDGNVKQATPRIGRDGKAVEIEFKDGSKIDISGARVKEWVPNTNPKAPPGTLQKVRFDNSLPGTKGYKRLPSQGEIDILNSFFD